MNENVIFLLSYIQTPIICMIAGLLVWKTYPEYCGMVGYKTRRSGKSPEAWSFAQIYWGRLITLISIPMLIFSVLTGVIQVVRNVGEDAGVIILMVVLAVQIVPIFVSIAVTEAALKRNFPDQ